MKSIQFTAFRSLGLISGLCLAVLAPSTASAALVDSFTDNFAPSIVTDIEGGGSTSGATQTGLPSVFNTPFSSRDITVEATSGPGGGSVTARILTGIQVFSYSSPDFTEGYFELTYSDLGGFDLDLNQVVIPVVSNDNGGIFTVTVTDTFAASSSGMAVLAGFGTTGDIVVALAGLANFTSIDKLVIRFDGEIATDMSFGTVNTITAIPEPSSLVVALTGLGLVGMFVRRRRNRLTA